MGRNVKGKTVVLCVLQVVIVVLSIFILNIKTDMGVDVSDLWSLRTDYNEEEQCWYVSENDVDWDGEIDWLFTPEMLFEKGEYEILLEYESDYEQVCWVADYESGRVDASITQMLRGAHRFRYRFSVLMDTYSAAFSVRYSGFGDLRVKGFTVKKYMDFNKRIYLILALLVVDIVLLLLLNDAFILQLSLAPKQKTEGKRHIILKCFGVIAAYAMLFATTTYIWSLDYFGNISMEEVIFTLSMPIAGTSRDILESFIQNTVVLSAVIVGAFLLVPIAVSLTGRVIKIEPFRFGWKFYSCAFVVWFVILLMLVNKRFGLFYYVQNQIMASSLIADEYVDPSGVDMVFPEEKRNLIYIFMESAESTLQDRENGGSFDANYIPELTQLAKENISFSQSSAIKGASVAPGCGWTMAGIVAETAGIPLKLYSQREDIDNSMGIYEKFLPGAYTIGDVLEANGYSNYFMCGSDAEYGGRKTYFEQHGNYTVFDYFTAVDEEVVDEDYYEGWGFEDEVLFAYAQNKLLEIAKKGEPFDFTMLTVDTHTPDGFYCDLCRNEHTDRYANVWSCQSRQIDAFVKWVQEQDFYENTSIVICGDHCSMQPNFFEDFNNKHMGNEKRNVYNLYINSAVEVNASTEKNRRFTTMDMYPTTLASLGVQIAGNRLGLGVNLFSGEATLAEKYGTEVLFDELGKKSGFYNRELLY